MKFEFESADCETSEYDRIKNEESEEAFQEFLAVDSCRNSLYHLIGGDVSPNPQIELIWYDQEVVLNEDMLDRTPLNPTGAEKTYSL